MRTVTVTAALVAAVLLVSNVAGTEPPGADSRAGFEAKRATVKADDADGLYRLALWAKAAGLAPESRETFSRVLRVQPDHRGARKALGYELIGGLWLRGDAAMRAKGLVRRDGEWILAEEAQVGDDEKRAEEEMARDALLALGAPDERVRGIAARLLEKLPPERLVRPCIYTLERGPVESRLHATERLAGNRSDEGLTALIRASIMDVSPEVRAAATVAVKAADHPDAVYPYLRAMESPVAPVRMNAAQAVGVLGDIRGIETVIRRLKAVHGGGPRVNLFVGRQMSYIRDFDVEIAQAAQIGDPIIGTLQEGVVLDVRVFNVEEEMTTVERRLLYTTLRKLTGQDLGEDTAAWVSWWQQNRERVQRDDDRGRRKAGR